MKTSSFLPLAVIFGGISSLWAAPTITTQPANARCAAGTTAIFSVTAASSGGPLHFQWQRNGADLSGATASNYTRSNIQKSDVGLYTCLVTDNTGSTFSNPGILYLDLVSSYIEGFESGNLNTWVTAPNCGALLTVTAGSFHKVHSGTYSCYVQHNQKRMYHNFSKPLPANSHFKMKAWAYDDGNGYVGASDMTAFTWDIRSYSGRGYGDGSLQMLLGAGKYFPSGNTTKYVYRNGATGGPGNTGWNYMSINRSPGWHEFVIEVNAGTVTWYVDGALGATATGVATGFSIDDIVIGVGVNGWNMNGDAWMDDLSVIGLTDTGPANPVFVTQPVSTTRHGDVNDAATFTAAADAAFGQNSPDADPLGYQWLKNGAALSGATATSYSIENPQSSDAGSYSCVAYYTGGSSRSPEAVLTVTNLPPTVDSQFPAGGDFAATPGDSLSFSVTAHATRAFNYQWNKNGSPLFDDGRISGATNSSLALGSVSSADAGTYSCYLSNADGSAYTAPVQLLVAYGPIVNSCPSDRSVALGSNATFTVSVAGPNLNYRWSKNFAPLNEDGRLSGTRTASLTIRSVIDSDAGLYTCQISNVDGTTSCGASLSVIDPPSFVSQPENQTVFLTSNAVFHVAGLGTPPLSYQWYKDGVPLGNGGDISGANSPDLTIQANAWTDEGVYSVVVSNSIVAVSSAGATLSIALRALPTVQDIVNQYSILNYSNVLSDKLFTHQGMNRADITGPQHNPCRDAILAEFQRLGLNPYLDQYTFTDTSGNAQTGWNVVAVLPGINNPNQEIYIASGHYDSIAARDTGWTSTPGADDDASGVACILEMARLFSHYNFAKTMVFCAFDNEEINDFFGAHRLGSVHYVSQHGADNIKGMISIDMIAWQTSGSLHNKADIESRDSMATIRGQLSSAINTYGGGLLVDARPGPGDWSDHVAFADAGFQACMLIEDDWWNNPNYHRITDFVENPGYIDWTYAGKMCKSAIAYFATQLQPAADPPVLTIQSYTNGAVLLTLYGTPGCKYAAEFRASLNMSVWAPLETNTTSMANGSLSFIDAPAGTRQGGFYRARWVP